MKFLKNSLLLSALISLLLLPVTAGAVGSEDPYDKIEKITQELIHIISLHQKDYPSNEKQYFAALTELLSDTVDFKYISKRVMGSYRANITPVQREEFANKFRMGLVETYGRGLINYGDQEIAIVNRSPLKQGQRTLVVQQEIRSSGKIFPLRYSMARKKTGEWMVINMTISGINLREIFRSQFSQAVQQTSGDFDAVISSWVTDVEKK
ncbi:MAG: MlaC/ttg2D family ABC transporter substrate-binding protein [Porticoccaceae bacterium]